MRKTADSQWIAMATVLILGCAGRAFGAESLVVPLEGAPFAATVSEIHSTGGVTFSSAGKKSFVVNANLVRFGSPSELAEGPIVVTADGGWFVVDEKVDPVTHKRLPPITLKDEKLSFDTRCLGKLALPLRQVLGLVLHRPSQPLEVDLLLDKIGRARAHSDQVLLGNGDQLNGTVTSLSNEKLKLEINGQVGQEVVETRNVVAVLFNSLLVKRPKPADARIMVGLSDGSRLPMATREGNGPLATQLGNELKLPLDKITWLMPQNHGVVFLSDLEPEGYRHTPYLDLAWPYHRDRNVLNAQLRSGGQLYAKGLGMHSAAVLSYALKKPYRRLDALLGIDDQTAGGGSVVLRVYVDTGDGKWQKRFESGVVRGGAKPTPISVDLAGAKRVSLLVDYADHGDELDHADWLDARLVP